ncbi:unnamed protein product [Diamesa tonsa]
MASFSFGTALKVIHKLVMKCLVVILLIFGALTVQSTLTVTSNNDISCIVDYLKSKGLIQNDVIFESYSGTQNECNEIIHKELEPLYYELNTKEFKHLSVYNMNDDSVLRDCMRNVYKLYNVFDYYLKANVLKHLNSTDLKFDPENAVEHDLPGYSSMICQIDKYVIYQYGLFEEALVDTKGESQEKDCLVEHLIELKKLPKELSSLIETPNHPNCNDINNKLYDSIRGAYKHKPATSFFAMPPSRNYELCLRNKSTKENSYIIQYVFEHLPHQQVNEQQKKMIKTALEDSMTTFAKIQFECLKFY